MPFFSFQKNERASGRFSDMAIMTMFLLKSRKTSPFFQFHEVQNEKYAPPKKLCLLCLALLELSFPVRAFCDFVSYFNPARILKYDSFLVIKRGSVIILKQPIKQKIMTRL